MFNPSTSLVRGAADACLRQVFGRAYGDLVMGQDSLLITNLIDFANDQHIGDLYRAAEQLQGRIGTGILADYVAALAEHRDPLSAHQAQGIARAQLVVEVPDEHRWLAVWMDRRITDTPNDRELAEGELAEGTGYTDAYGRATQDLPAEDDAYIHDRASGGYDAYMGEWFLGPIDRRWQAEQAIVDEMQRSGFFPNVWLQDDHGGLTLLDATEADFGRDPDRVLHTHTVAANVRGVIFDLPEAIADAAPPLVTGQVDVDPLDQPITTTVGTTTPVEGTASAHRHDPAAPVEEEGIELTPDIAARLAAIDQVLDNNRQELDLEVDL
jgi:hypothetical protein